MGLKDLDFKQVLLQKGERIGLGVAVGIMALLLIYGVGKGLGSASSASTAKEIEDLRASADNRIMSSEPAPVPPETYQSFIDGTISFWRIHPEEYALRTPFFTPTSIEDKKRRKPDILNPTELHAEVIRAGLRGISISKNGQILVLRDKSLATQNSLGQTLGSGRGGFMAGPPPGSGMGMGDSGGGDMGDTGGGDMGMGMPGGAMMGSGMDMMGGLPTDAPGAKKILKMEYVDLDKLDKTPNAKLAETIYPLHIAVVTASFPYEAQMQEFRRALRKATLWEMLDLINAGEASWEFKGLEIERRFTDHTGTKKTDWEPFHKIQLDAFRYWYQRSVGFEAPEPKLMKYAGVANLGLMQPLFKLARDQKWPEPKLASLDKAIAKLDEMNKTEKRVILSMRAKKIKGESFDPFNPLGSEPAGDPNLQGGMGGMMPGGSPMGSGMNAPGSAPGSRPMGSGSGMGMGDEAGQPPPEPVVPESCLIRFIDPTVIPGYTYEYRVKVKMANPNYGRKDVAFKSLATMKELTASEWSSPVSVKVPPSTFLYAVDEKPERGQPAGESITKDRAPFQIHKWLSYVLTNPENPQSVQAVADWAVLERHVVYKGEYIGRAVPTKLPVWVTAMDDWALAMGKNRQRQVPVDFSTRPNPNALPAVLVDFEGGKALSQRVGTRSISEETPMQMLVLMPDGKLMVRSSDVDTEDAERKERVESRRKWVKEVESGKKDGQKPQGTNLFDRPGGSPP